MKKKKKSSMWMIAGVMVAVLLLAHVALDQLEMDVKAFIRSVIVEEKHRVNLITDKGLSVLEKSERITLLFRLDHCEIYALRSGTFLIVIHSDKRYLTDSLGEFADGLDALERQGYRIVTQLPSVNLPPNMMAVWTTKKEPAKE